MEMAAPEKVGMEAAAAVPEAGSRGLVPVVEAVSNHRVEKDRVRADMGAAPDITQASRRKLLEEFLQCQGRPVLSEVRKAEQ